MTADAESLILHQYEVSPFSEKVRVALGIKGLAWHACDQPVIMPKPEMVRLTGGYRRIPVLQVGADLWFDSLYIIEELDRRQPKPPAFAGSGVGVASAFARWCDGEFFMTIVGLLFGGDWEFDEAFVKDRSELIGAPFDPGQMATAAPALAGQLRQHLDLMETQLADGRAFLTGAAPDAIDAAVYCQTAFIRWGRGATARIVDEFPRLCAWERRVAALGHGDRQADVDRETAIAIARDATPAPIINPSGDGVFAPGDAVAVKFHDANSPTLKGTLLRADQRTLSLKPAHAEAGDIHIQMPRSVGALSRR
jgi:glutathione S-transferase